VEKIHKVLTVDGKDIRKAEWNNKEVSESHLRVHNLCDEKELLARITQLVEKGVTPQYNP
jgi:hypothetical protein